MDVNNATPSNVIASVQSDPSTANRPYEATHAILAAEQAQVTELRAQVASLRKEVEALEARAERLGPDAAAVWPEDLGDWTSATPRMQGLVTRVIQTAQLASEVRKLRLSFQQDA